MKRALLDQGLAPAAASILRSLGWEAWHVNEVGMSRAGDPAILAYAREHRMACVTLDHDFHAHLAQTSADGPSVVFLRAEGMGAVEQAGLIESVWLTCEEAIDAGGAISADGSTVRLRRLPLK